MTAPVLQFEIPIFTPVEDLLLAVFRPLEDAIPGLTVVTRIPEAESLTTPFVLVRGDVADWTSDSFAGNDTRFIRRAIAEIQTFTTDPDGETKGGLLSEIARQRLWAVKRSQTVFPGLGHITSVRTNSPAHAVSDWATSTGVVQYANIPKGVHRFEAKYGIGYRPDFDNPILVSDVLDILTDS